jgi:Transposase, Mutator family
LLGAEETFAQDKNKSGPGVGVVAFYCAMSPHTGIRIGVDED